jgi:hypothetical protein
MIYGTDSVNRMNKRVNKGSLKIPQLRNVTKDSFLFETWSFFYDSNLQSWRYGRTSYLFIRDAHNNSHLVHMQTKRQPCLHLQSIHPLKLWVTRVSMKDTLLFLLWCGVYWSLGLGDGCLESGSFTLKTTIFCCKLSLIGTLSLFWVRLETVSWRSGAKHCKIQTWYNLVFSSINVHSREGVNSFSFSVEHGWTPRKSKQ